MPAASRAMFEVVSLIERGAVKLKRLPTRSLMDFTGLFGMVTQKRSSRVRMLLATMRMSKPSLKAAMAAAVETSA